jgi:hypothetical protein
MRLMMARLRDGLARREAVVRLSPKVTSTVLVKSVP